MTPRFERSRGIRMIRHSRSASIAAFLVAGCASAPVAYPDATLEGLFESERAFARASTERGIRASFLEYFANDGIDFRPGPGSMRERTRARPAPADPLALLLDWSPQAGAVARSGDLGFTTGPYVLRNQRDASVPARYGYFFSVWKRENGVWRVALDAGVSTPGAPGPDSLRLPASDESKPTATARLLPAMRSDRGKDALLALERPPWSLDPEPGEATSYFAMLSNSVRVLREGSYALLGPDAVHKALASRQRRMQWTPVDAGTSQSDDFGYTYGSYVRLDGATREEGYYAHVWQRDDAGAWRIALEVLLPPE